MHEVQIRPLPTQRRVLLRLSREELVSLCLQRAVGLLSPTCSRVSCHRPARQVCPCAGRISSSCSSRATANSTPRLRKPTSSSQYCTKCLMPLAGPTNVSARLSPIRSPTLPWHERQPSPEAQHALSPPPLSAAAPRVAPPLPPLPPLALAATIQTAPGAPPPIVPAAFKSDAAPRQCLRNRTLRFGARDRLCAMGRAAA